MSAMVDSHQNYVCCFVQAANLPQGSAGILPYQYPMMPVMDASWANMAAIPAPMAAQPNGVISGPETYNFPQVAPWAWPMEGQWASNDACIYTQPAAPKETGLDQDQFHANVSDASTSSGPASNDETCCENDECEGTSQAQSLRELPEVEEAHAKEIANELLGLMQDGPEGQWSACARFRHLAFSSKIECLAAQMALESASASDKAVLVFGLQDCISSAVLSKHANYVVAKVLEIMPMARASFVAEELVGRAVDVACHRIGCRTLCRILEHLSVDHCETTRQLLEELLWAPQKLITHTYGSYVVRHIIEFGSDEHRHRIAMALLTRPSQMAKHKMASHVVEASLRKGSPEDQSAIVAALIAESQLASISKTQYGRHVFQAMREIPGELGQTALDALRRVEQQTKASKPRKGAVQASLDRCDSSSSPLSSL